MKKLLICLFIMTLFFITGCKKDEPEIEEPKVEEKYIMDLDVYEDLVLDDVVSIEKIRFTEGGDIRETITAKDEITRIYNMLKETKIKGLTDRACEDNTTVYVLKTKENSYSFEFECDWFLYDNNRYNVVK